MRIVKNIFSFLFSRLFIVAVMLVVQIALFITLLMFFSNAVFYVYLSLNLLSFFAVLGIISNNENPSYKLTWIIAVLVFPLTGGVFYLLFGNKRMPATLKARVARTLNDAKQHMPPNTLSDKLEENWINPCKYIYNLSGSPLFEATSSEYYPVGERMFESMKRELELAEHFIFLEFFIIRPGQMWDAIFGILQRKAAEGVDVRLIYDDLGCIKFLPKRYDKIITDAGIKLCVFNPFKPRVSVILNHRDHRKLVVIDGKTAFCGGINIADEYINEYERFGHWKDTGVMLKGEGVWPFTFMFLEMWHFATEEFIDYEAYRPEKMPSDNDGFVQPFGDTPLDSFNVTETTYLNAIYSASRYIYITTPYLVIDSEMECALCSAAQAGVEVRIITPYIYDKWYVHLLTRSHYPRLIEAGVKIYEYTPGFMHGKMFVCDDEVCMVGTCNMDFRSFYLHFECGVMFYDSRVVADVKKDMLDSQQLSHEITFEETQEISIPKRILRSFLKVFAPLM